MKYYFYKDKLRSHKRLKVILTAVVIVIFISGGYLLWKSFHKDAVTETKKDSRPKELPRMVNLPPKKPKPEPVPTHYAPDAPLLEQVRSALRNGIDPDVAVVLAKSLSDKPERADAVFILLEYAAEAGHAEAALEVGRYFDPTYSGDSGTIIKDPEAAYEWYQASLSGGQQEAKNHLSDLKRWVEKQAAEGSFEARELLNNWF